MKLRMIEFNIWKKRFIALVSDITVTVISWFVAIWLSTDSLLSHLTPFSMIAINLIQALMYVQFGLYRGVWRFASIPDLIRILRAVLFGAAINIIFLKINGLDVPFKAYIIYVLFLITLLSGSRILFRWVRDYPRYFSQGKRILVVGAGSAGEGLIRDLYRSYLVNKYLPIAFVDDDPMRLGSEVQGLRVLGSCHDIPKIVTQYRIELIFIAIPSASSKRMREIVGYCEDAKIPFRTLPGLKSIADGIVKTSLLREILLEDLLGREQVHHDLASISEEIRDKVILVTGGGGSIGSELCRQICQLAPTKLIVIDKSEFNLYTIEMELQKLATQADICCHLCDVTDKIEMQKIFHTYTPNMVFHVAAYKHVPLLEKHIRVAMHNNIIGTKVIAEMAAKNRVETFVLISTDKAVNPTNIMGATKRAAEVFCQTLDSHSSTRYITVRFGNVLNSAGSVIPLFKQQLLNGGPITVTHPHISRYFMTIPEAAQLILQTTTMNNEGQIFVLDMGEPINIRYLAEQMIKLSGKIIGQDIDIKYTGLRPGEKLHEELFYANETMNDTSHSKIRRAKVQFYDWEKLLVTIAEIEAACSTGDENHLLVLLLVLVPEYKQDDHQDKSILEVNAKRSDASFVLSPMN
jgi:FlaA1/EpsC-like NDP-sugar epimerase